jgi:hypothetical protein
MAVHGRERVRGEGGLAVAAGHGQAVADVVLRLLAAQRGQVVARGHALGELAQLVPAQHLLQLRLAHEHDLDELLGVRLQVRDEADLLQHLRREVLRLVDEEDDVAALRARLEQEPVERVHVVLQGRTRGRDVQVFEDGAQQLGRGQGGVEHERGGGARIEARQEVARERGLARADLARDEDEPALLLAPELEVREGLGVTLGEVQVLGVGGQVERLLREAVEGLVHLLPSTLDVAADAVAGPVAEDQELDAETGRTTVAESVLAHDLSHRAHRPGSAGEGEGEVELGADVERLHRLSSIPFTLMLRLVPRPGSVPGAVCDHTAMLTDTRASRRRGTCSSSSIQASQR